MGGGSAAGSHQAQTATSMESNTRQKPDSRHLTEDSQLSPEKRRARALSALLASMQQPDHVRKIRGDFSAVEKIGPEDIQAAVEMVLARNHDQRESDLPQLMERWAEMDPKAAAAYALGLREGMAPWFIGRVFGGIATVWSRQDPAAAKAWIVSLPAGKDRDFAINGLAAGMAQSEPTATLEWVKALPEEMRPEYVHEQIFLKWGESDPLSASQQALALPLGEDRWESLSAVAYSWAKKDPQAAFSMLQQVPESGARNEQIAETLVTWAGKDPSAAMDAANQMPLGGIRTHVYDAILTSAAEQGGAELSGLLEKIPEGPERDMAARKVAEGSKKDTE